MRSQTHGLSISVARADALFASALQRSDQPSAARVQQAITTAVRVFGTRGCAARVAQAYGEHPETAVLRMRWARAAVTDAFGGAPAGPAHSPAVSAGPAHTPAGQQADHSCTRHAA
jgi:hypothetical protein